MAAIAEEKHGTDCNPYLYSCTVESSWRRLLGRHITTFCGLGSVRLAVGLDERAYPI